MNPCAVLQVLTMMWNVHLATPADHMKIQNVIDFQKTECAAYEEKHKKEKK